MKNNACYECMVITIDVCQSLANSEIDIMSMNVCMAMFKIHAFE